MAGGIENHDDSMEESDGFMESTEHSECDLSDVGDMEFYDDANEVKLLFRNGMKIRWKSSSDVLPVVLIP